MADTLRDQLRNYLDDVYSIEQQALAQLRTAPDLVGDPTLAGHFRTHLAETEQQAELVEARLTALGGSPSKVKDAVMRLGGKGFLLFARTQPDTTGKLLSHALSYEALEWAAYELLMRLAERAGDADTAAMARTIRDQEKEMVDRLEGCFDGAVEASLREAERESGDDLDTALRHYLADAHALEAQSIQLLEKSREIGGDPELNRLYSDHLEDSRRHAREVEERLQALGGDTSVIKDTALRAAGFNWGLFFQAQPDTPAKLAAFVFAFEHLEIGGYEQLRRVAERAGDTATVDLCDRLLTNKRAAAEAFHGALDRALEASLDAVGVTA